jgi:branched-chain amino acid transport system permease protein
MPERRYLVACAAVVLLLALLPLAGSRYAVDLATEVLIYVLFALSLNVIIGFTGNISFGHAAYFAIGGYACAILLTTYGWPLLFALPAAVVLAGMVAAVVGYFCVRLTQIYFAMLTLAFAMLVWGVCFKWKEVTGGDDGFTGIKLPAMLAHHVGYFYFTLAVVAVGVAALWVICHSAFGLTLVAVRENSVRAGFIGVDTRRMRWAAFTVAGTFGGLAGALFGMYHRGMYIENAFWTESAQVLIMVLLGGIYSFVGPILGAAVLYLLQVFTNQYLEALRPFAAIRATVVAAGVSRDDDAYVRLVVTRGVGALGLAFEPRLSPTIVVVVAPANRPDAAAWERGIRVAMVDPAGRLSWVVVTLGAGEGGWHELTHPSLAAGTRVVVEGQRGLPEGTRVKPIP